MHIVWRHNRLKEEIKSKIDSLFPETILRRFRDDVKCPIGNWDNDIFNFSFHVIGSQVNGTIIVDIDSLTLDAELPLLARPFEDALTNSVESELSELFDRSP